MEFYNAQEYQQASEILADVLSDANELFGATDKRCVLAYKTYGTSLLRGVTVYYNLIINSKNYNHK